MRKIIVAGIGTEVGKTVACAILMTLYGGDYWKPIQTGCRQDLDTVAIKGLIHPEKHRIHPPAYTFSAPVSPHQAARLENQEIKWTTIQCPSSMRPLIIEAVGGIYTPITTDRTSFELFSRWGCPWIVVSKHYLGSINHTLLTLEALKRQNIPIWGIVFNGKPNYDSEAAILGISKVPFLARLLPESHLNPNIIQRYADEWKEPFAPLI